MVGMGGMGMAHAQMQIEMMKMDLADKAELKLSQVFGVEDGADLFPYVITRGVKLREKKDGDGWFNDPTIQGGYIRWDALCHLFNQYFIPIAPKSGAPIFTLQCHQVVNEEMGINVNNIRGGRHIEPLYYNRVSSPLEDKVATKSKGLMDFSCDPTICLLPHQIFGLEGALLNRSATISPGFASIGILPPNADEYSQAEHMIMCAYKLTEDEHDTAIGNIYLNFETAYKTYQGMRYDEEGLEKEDFSMYDYVKKLWEDINGACSNQHEFTLVTDHERPNIVKVVDMSYKREQNLNPKDIVKLNIQSNDSIFREFSYNTSIPSSMTSTIAIAAQSPDSVSDIEAASFAALHKSIRSRLATRSPKRRRDQSKIDEQRQKWADVFDADVQAYKDGMKDLEQFRHEVLGGDYSKIDSDTGDAAESGEITRMKGVMKSMNKLATDLMKRYGRTDEDVNPPFYKGQPNDKIANNKRSAVIPLKFTGTMDGISGIIIGNVFQINESRLPRGYKEAHVAFVCMGEEQQITAGQDWTTKITGQLVLLDDPNKPDGVGDGDFLEGGYNEFNEEEGVNYVGGEAGADAQGISEAQRTVPGCMEDVHIGDDVYLKLTEPTNLRLTPEIDNEQDWLRYRDNIIGMIDADSSTKYTKLGKVIDVKWADSIHGLTWNEELERYEDKDTGKPVGDINSKVPWYKIRFNIKSYTFRKIFQLGWVRRHDGTIDENGANKWREWYTDSWNFEGVVWHNEQFQKPGNSDHLDYVKGEGWLRIDVLTCEEAIEAEEAIEEEEDRLKKIYENEVLPLEKKKLMYKPGIFSGTRLDGDAAVTANYAKKYDLQVSLFDNEAFAMPHITNDSLTLPQVETQLTERKTYLLNLPDSSSPAEGA